MAQKRHIVYKTTHLKDRISWTAGLAGVIRMLTWETKNALGIDKTELQRHAIHHADAMRGYKLMSKEELKEITDLINKRVNKTEVSKANVEGLFDEPKTGMLINPIEAQRRLRIFSEEFLNKEFDVFASLLPNHVITDYLSNHFAIRKESEWTIVGSSNDFEASTGMKFMYMDTLAYSHNTSTLVAIELKMDSPLGKDQLLKYCFMAAYLEQRGMIAPNTNFKILILGNDNTLTDIIPSLMQEAKNQLQTERFPKKKITREEVDSLVPRTSELLAKLEIKNTTWQEFGTYFDTLRHKLPENSNAETLCKLIDGFLISLQTKYSRKLKRVIYVK